MTTTAGAPTAPFAGPSAEAQPPTLESLLADLIPEDQAAALLDLSVNRLRRLRYLGEGPPLIWIGRKRKPYYRLETLRRWLIEQERPPSNRPAGPPERRTPRVRRTASANGKTGAAVCQIPRCSQPVVPRTGPGPRNRYCREHIDINARRRAMSRGTP